MKLAEIFKQLDFPKHKTVAFLEGGGVEYHFSSYSAFVQGSGVGIWEGLLSYAGIQWHKVNSKTWKTLFGLIGTKENKKVKVFLSYQYIHKQVHQHDFSGKQCCTSKANLP